jgi:Fur family zinc uptake transcriptional regulator
MSDNKHTHNHKDCQHAALQGAEVVCAAQGVRLTAIRKRVLELVWASHKAVKAYDVLAHLDAGDGAQAPATVYRALDFLQANGLVHKIESLNAFVGCGHPADRHSCQFFICDACGDVSECCDSGVAAQIGRNAAKVGFHPSRQMLEVHGTCAACRAS